MPLRHAWTVVPTYGEKILVAPLSGPQAWARFCSNTVMAVMAFPSLLLSTDWCTVTTPSGRLNREACPTVLPRTPRISFPRYHHCLAFALPNWMGHFCDDAKTTYQNVLDCSKVPGGAKVDLCAPAPLSTQSSKMEILLLMPLVACDDPSMLPVSVFADGNPSSPIGCEMENVMKTDANTGDGDGCGNGSDDGGDGGDGGDDDEPRPPTEESSATPFGSSFWMSNILMAIGLGWALLDAAAGWVV